MSERRRERGHAPRSSGVIPRAEDGELASALRASDERFRLALRASNAAVFEQDHELRYTWKHDLDGSGSSELAIGRTDAELMPPDEAEQLTRIKRGVLETGVPAREAVRVTVGGRARHFDLHVEPRRDASGAVVGVLCAAWDVTERVEAEAALRASEARFRALADAMPQLVWIARSDGVVEYYNARAREYSGVRQDADGTWRWEPVVHEDDLARTIDAWNRAVASNAISPDAPQIYACEHRVRMADGSYRWHVSRAHRMRDEDGDRWFGTATDIHEQKLAEEALHEALAARDQVASAVSHDLRGPLGVVRTSVPILRALLHGGGPREHGERVLVRVERQVARMQALLDELLDTSRLRAGHTLELDLGACDLVALVRELVDEHAHTTRHRLEVRTTAASLVFALDRRRIERVISNLLSNAEKYSAPGQPIAIVVGTSGNEARVRITDRGIGIAAEDRERIFEWFARGTNATGATHGVGVGLAGARRIVEQHGGSLEVESELGVGSTFTVRLPMRE